MVTKALGWSTAVLRAARFVALSVGVSALVVVLATNVAQAQAKKGRERIVELNKKALESFEAKDFEAAREALTKALKEAKQTGLEDDKMTARTYLHLGAVYWTGFRDQNMALQNFALAKRIRPDIQLTPAVETPELRSIFDLAGSEPESQPSAPAPAPNKNQPARLAAAAPPPPAPEPGIDTRSGKKGKGAKAAKLVEDGEPDLPSSMSAPLMCTVPDEAAPEVELTLRCALKSNINAKTVQFHYRVVGEEAYKSVDMRRTAKGWYVATLPMHVMKVGRLQVYFDARGANDNELASNNHPDSPGVIDIRKPSEGGELAKDEDPMKRLRDAARLDRYETGLHRRRAGAIWVAPGAGMAWGWAQGGNLEWETAIKVSAVGTVAGLFHGLGEFGYMVSDDFAISVQGRLEIIKQDEGKIQLQCSNPPCPYEPYTAGKTGQPATQAPAVLARAIWYSDVTDDGNFRLSYGIDFGGGYVRLPINPLALKNVPQGENNQPDFSTYDRGKPYDTKTRYVAKTDTRPIGVVLAGVSGGFQYHVARWFALSLEGRAMAGGPDIGMVFEGNFALQFAFGGKRGPTPIRGEDDEEEEGNPDERQDEPAPADSAPASDAPAPSDDATEAE